MSSSAAIRAALRGHEPSTEQLTAIEFDPVPLAIIAGAGSGKTAIMAARMVSMVERGIVAPSQILGLTFTNKAADELEERIVTAFAELDPVPAEIPAIATYNSFADKLVREHGVRIGIDPESALLSQGQSWQLVLKALDDVPAFDAIDSRSVSKICQGALALSEECHNHFVSPEAVAAEDRRIVAEPKYFGDDAVLASRRRIELTGLVRAYIDQKVKARCIDYGDQVSKAVEILTTFPDLAKDLSARYPAILLDEYQDTNVAQRKMLEALAPCGANVTAVGDARQNIFQWRGSTLFNLIDFGSKHFLRQDGKQHEYLSASENFRSGSKILAVANALIEAVPAERRPGKPLEPLPENQDGFVGTKLLADQWQEAAFIAEEIKRLHGTAANSGRPPMAWKDFAVLVRRRKHIGPIYDALKQRDIPVEVTGLGGLMQVAEIMDLVAWLRVVADPGPPSNRWLARILLGPRFRIHYRDLAVLARWAAQHTKELADTKRESLSSHDGGEVLVPDETELEPDDVAFSLAEALDHLDEISDLAAEAELRLGRAGAEIRSLRSKAAGPLLELVRATIRESGIAETLQSSPRRDSAASQANLQQFVDMVSDFAPVSGDPSLHEFLAYLDAAEDAADPMELGLSSSEDSVKLTTVHRVKGLEFETVFVPGVAARENEKGVLVDSMFPDERISNPMTSYSQAPFGVREDQGHLPNPWTIGQLGERILRKKAEFDKELRQRAVEDERRLFYVALTRAKQRLYVTAAWWYERQTKPRGPSSFLNEVNALEAVVKLGEAAMPAESPLMAALAERAVWPPTPPNTLIAFQEFPESYPVALDRLLSGELSADDLLARLDPAERTEAEARLAGHRATLAGLDAGAGRPGGEGGAAKPGRPIRSLSATQAIGLASEKFSLRKLLRPLPESPSVAGRLGTEVHRWIEEHARGLTGLVDEQGMDLPAASVDPDRLALLKQNYLDLYGHRTFARFPTGEPMAEVPFVLKIGGFQLRGRIDAVYENDLRGLEIVDFKTGANFESPEIDQLAVYAGAIAKLGIGLDRPMKLTYCFLQSRETPSRSIDGPDAIQALKQLEQRLGGLFTS
ncbi:MAG: UvrD-helicase domain-containing protein [Actinomycetota bacterium]